MLNIKVYTTPTCSWCGLTKDYLEKKDLNFEEIDVSKDEKAAVEMVQKSGQMGVPVIDINGTIIIGFDKFAIDATLKNQAN